MKEKLPYLGIELWIKVWSDPELFQQVGSRIRKYRSRSETGYGPFDIKNK
jgi:hypothetical protein